MHANPACPFPQPGPSYPQDLASKFGVTPPVVLSTRDVPGMPRSAIPILAAAGVTALSEGMNSRMIPVNVPPFFNWRDKASGTSMLTLWHWHGYGQLGEPGNPIRVPGSSHALAYCWRGDNQGPPMSAEEVNKNRAALERQYPGAKVVSSTLDGFVAAVRRDGAEAELPTIEQEVTPIETLSTRSPYIHPQCASLGVSWPIRGSGASDLIRSRR